MRPPSAKRLFRFPFRSRSDVRTEIADEFEFHIDMRVDELVRLGAAPDDARAQALGEFGNRAAGAAACARHDDRHDRRLRIARWVDELRQDTAIGLRLLTRSPGFAAVAILTLALGIGANAAIFSALDPVLLRALPFPESDRLVQVFETLENGSLNSVSGGVFRDWREHSTRFDSLALASGVTWNLSGRGDPERLTGVEVSHEFLRVFGIQPIRGQGFSAAHEAPGGENDVVMLTEELWRSRFGADEMLLGDTIVLDSVPRRVIAILPAGAWMFRDAAFFVPAVLQPDSFRSTRSGHWAEVYGRLRAAVTVREADAELKGIKQRLRTEYPAFKQRWNVAVRPLQQQLAGDSRPALLTVSAAVGLVLLIACANVANLLLARGCSRRQEVALRSALGATSRRLLRQMLTESVLLAALGGAAGILVAYWGVALMQQLTADLLPLAMTPRLDTRVLGFTVAITVLTGLLFGILPAWRARRPDVNDALKNGGKGATAGGHRRTQATLVIVEIALTAVLLACAGLLLRSLARSSAADPGFDAAGLLAFDLSLPDTSYPSADGRLAFSRALLDRLRGLPGVEGAGTGMAIPFSGGGSGEYLNRADRPAERDRGLGRVDFVSEGYLEALGTRLLAGRRLRAADNQPGAPRVAVVNDALLRYFFPGEDAIGRRLSLYGEQWEIVGVIANLVHRRADLAHRPSVYVAQAFNPFSFSVVVRTASDPLPLVESIRQQVRQLDAGLPLANVRTLEQAMAASMAERRVIVSLTSAFATAALALACLGLYGVMAYTVATRRRELCIRMALGADARAVVGHVLRDGLRMTIAGLAVGFAAALGAARLLTSQLYQVQSYDPLVMAAAFLALSVVAAAACWLPAWKAARFDPISALRND
jgi:predicted permease